MLHKKFPNASIIGIDGDDEWINGELYDPESIKFIIKNMEKEITT
jgi:hypothetical protein